MTDPKPFTAKSTWTAEQRIARAKAKWARQDAAKLRRAAYRHGLADEKDFLRRSMIRTPGLLEQARAAHRMQHG